MTRRLIVAVLAASLASSAAPSARAGLLPVSVTTTPEAGDTRFTYGVELPTNSQLRSGDYFTVYDFAGYVAGSAQFAPAPSQPSTPSNWTVTVANVGTTPNRLLPTDDPNLPNLTWTYSGPTINTGQLGLGNFSAASLYGNETSSSFTAQTHTTVNGVIDSNVTATTVPVPGVPEPTTLALAGLGLPLLALRRAVRRRPPAA